MIFAARQIREMEAGKHIPVLVITAYRDGLRIQVLKAGCNQVIGKPVEYKSVLKVISSYI